MIKCACGAVTILDRNVVFRCDAVRILSQSGPLLCHHLEGALRKDVRLSQKPGAA